MAYSCGSGKNCTIVNCRNNYKKFCQMWANRSICSYSDFNLTRIMQSLYYAPAGHYIISIEGAVLYGRNIIPPHICYSIIVQMIDFLINCISAPYIIKYYKQRKREQSEQCKNYCFSCRSRIK
jgi:hypothetical protein